jgi:hypothetical protein
MRAAAFRRHWVLGRSGAKPHSRTSYEQQGGSSRPDKRRSRPPREATAAREHPTQNSVPVMLGQFAASLRLRCHVVVLDNSTPAGVQRILLRLAYQTIDQIVDQSRRIDGRPIGPATSS